MSIPQICPSCEHHISAAHAKDCCYGTPEYAHLGWPNYQVTTGTGFFTSGALTKHSATLAATMEELSKDGFVDSGSAIRRLLDYLNDEPEEAPEAKPAQAAISLLSKRSEELRKEAAGMYNVEARAKRNFAADVLENLISELSE